jgi:hypothetical protein
MSFVEDMPMKVLPYGLPPINQLVEISPFYLAGCDRLLIGVSATVAQHLDLIGGSGYYLVVELFRGFVDPLSMKISNLVRVPKRYVPGSSRYD